VNRFLPNAFSPGALADTEALRVGEPPQRPRIHQRIVEHEIRLLEICHGAPRPEIWISRSGAD
jgi:hypothetical protein